MNLKELVHQANQLVQKEGNVLQELLQKNDFPANAPAIIELLKLHSDKIDPVENSEYDSLMRALSKRREISLKATYAAILHLMQPIQFPLKSLDNSNSNLQSEKGPRKEHSMAESEELSQDDIEALLAGNLAEKKNTKPAPAAPKAAAKDDQLSNDDIEALLSGLAPTKTTTKKEDVSEDDLDALLSQVAPAKPASKPSPVKTIENFSQDDIEALLAGEASKKNEKPTDKNDANLSDDEINQLLSDANPGEGSDQISEDDIQSLLNAQQEQDKVNPLVQALSSEEEKLAVSAKPRNTDKFQQKPSVQIVEMPPNPADDSSFEKTNMPQDVFPAQEDLEGLIKESEALAEEKPTPIPVNEVTPLIDINPVRETPAPNKTFISSVPPKPISEAITSTNAKVEEIMGSGEVKERILSDIYALYVNNGSKPTLHAQCATREEVKKAYLQAMQSFPQNALFIEKISRKEIIVVKETKEIINLKVNISFD